MNVFPYDIFRKESADDTYVASTLHESLSWSATVNVAGAIATEEEHFNSALSVSNPVHAAC